MQTIFKVAWFVFLLCVIGTSRSDADVAWDTVQQLTNPPFYATYSMGYNNARNIGAHGDSVYVVCTNSSNELYVLRSFDGGDTWDAPIGSGLLGLAYPAIAVDDSGFIHIACCDGMRDYLLYAHSRDAGMTWFADTLVVFPGLWYNVDASPAFEIDYEGNLHIVYTLTDNGTVTETYYLRSSDQGATWTGPTVLIPITPHHGGPWVPSLASDRSGRLHIVIDVWWNLGSWQPKQSYLSSPDLGVTWDTLEHIVTHMATGRYGLDTYGKDTLAFCWSLYSSFEIFMRASVNGGNPWMSPIQISDNAGGGDHWSCLAFDTGGGMHIVWNDPGYWGIAYRYVSPDFVPADTIARLSNLPGQFAIPDVYCDRKGRVHVAWTQQPLDETTYQIFYRRGTVYTDVEESTHEQKQQAGLSTYPSIFSQAVSIQTRADATVTIYNISGQRVRSFNSQKNKAVTWDATDDVGRKLPTGVYIVEAVTHTTSNTHKIVYVE